MGPAREADDSLALAALGESRKRKPRDIVHASFDTQKYAFVEWRIAPLLSFSLSF